MSKINPLDALLNLLATNRLEDAKKDYADNPQALSALSRIERDISSGETFRCSCQECGEWNGVDRCCDCGDRRVYWLWKDNIKEWLPEVY